MAAMLMHGAIAAIPDAVLLRSSCVLAALPVFRTIKSADPAISAFTSAAYSEIAAVYVAALKARQPNNYPMQAADLLLSNDNAIKSGDGAAPRHLALPAGLGERRRCGPDRCRAVNQTLHIAGVSVRHAQRRIEQAAGQQDWTSPNARSCWDVPRMR